MKLKQYFFPGVILLSVFLLTGCFDSRLHYTLNPDGSGKLEFNIVYDAKNYLEMNREDLREIFDDLKFKEEGIRSLKDVEIEEKGESQMVLSGTAYFDNINNVELSNDGFSTGPYKIRFSTEDGQGRLELLPKKGPPNISEQLPAALVTQLVAEHKQRYDDSRALIDSSIGKSRMSITFTLPGETTRVINMQKKQAEEVFLEFDGLKAIQVMESFVADDNWWLRNITPTYDFFVEGPYADEDLNQALFGDKDEIKAEIMNVSEPIVDFAKELRGAVVEWSTFETSGEPIAYSGEELPLQEVTVLNQSMNHAPDLDPATGLPRELWGSAPEQSYTLTLVARVPEDIIAVTGGKIISAMTDREQSLMLMDDAQTMVDDILLKDSGDFLRFQLRLLEPGQASTRIAKIAGFLTGFIGRDLKEIDLGMEGFEPGLTSARIKTRIEALGRDPDNFEYEVLTLRINLPEKAVKDIRFFDEGDREMEIEPEVVQSLDEEVLVNCRLKGRFPLRGRILLQAYDDIRKVRILFSLKDIDFLGRPVQQ